MEIRNTGTEKECEICGAWFAQTNPTQKYCPECRKDSWNLKRDMDRNIRRSIREYGTGRKIEPIRNVCKFCGKEFETWKYEKDYCSQECRTEAKIAATRCQNCGKSMTELGIHEKVTGAWFCSDNCRKEWKWTVARKEGAVKICPVCGKEFLGRKYCSRECYLASVKSKKKDEAKKEPKYTKARCHVCGREFLWRSGSRNLLVCSEACRKEFFSLISTAQTEPVQKRDKKKEQERMVLENGLCSVCLTSYKDCERMPFIKFTKSPEGSVFNGWKIVECPKFKS